MEKARRHYPLSQVLAAMKTVEDMCLTVKARQGIRQLGMDEDDALNVIKALVPKNFYKSMTTYKDHRVWQDVYHSEWQGIPLYIKFQKTEQYFVVSFKEKEEDVL